MDVEACVVVPVATLVVAVVVVGLLSPIPIQTARSSKMVKFARRAVSQSSESQVFQAKSSIRVIPLSDTNSSHV